MVAPIKDGVKLAAGLNLMEEDIFLCITQRTMNFYPILFDWIHKILLLEGGGEMELALLAGIGVMTASFLALLVAGILMRDVPFLLLSISSLAHAVTLFCKLMML